MHAIPLLPVPFAILFVALPHIFCTMFIGKIYIEKEEEYIEMKKNNKKELSHSMKKLFEIKKIPIALCLIYDLRATNDS